MMNSVQPPKSPEPSKNYFLQRLQEYGRRIFDLVCSAIFFYIVEIVIHTMLAHLGVDEKTKLGKMIASIVKYGCGLAYLIFVAHLLIPDASEHIADAWNRMKAPWKRSTARKRKE